MENVYGGEKIKIFFGENFDIEGYIEFFCNEILISDF